MSQTPIDRRESLRRLAAAFAATLPTAGLVGAGEPAAERPPAEPANQTTGEAGPDSARSPLGIAVYALGVRRRLLDYCRALGAGGVQMPLGVRDAEYCHALRAEAERHGMFIEGIVNPPMDDQALDRFDAELRTVAACGATVVRTVIMPGRRYEQFDSLEAVQQAAAAGWRAVERAVPVAERRRVRLSVENHKDQRAEERLDQFRRIGSEYLGACVDVGNGFPLLEDPLETVAAYAPYALTVHLKDYLVQEYPDGFLLAEVALGDGWLDLTTMVETLRRAKPGVRFHLESITRDPLKVPCLTEKYWAALGDVPGAALARTLRTVRTHAAAELPRWSDRPLEAQAEAEVALVRRSLAFGRSLLAAR